MPFDRTIPYNDLPFLTEDKSPYYTAAVLEKLISARAALAELKGSTLRLPSPAMLISTIGMQEAKDSSTIENIITTTDALYKALAIDSQEAAPATKEVLNYKAGLWSGVAAMREQGSIDLGCIINVFKHVKELERGELRRPALSKEHHTQIRKRAKNSFEEPEIIYTPPDGEGVLEAYLENLFEFINDDEKYAFDPLLKLAISHYQFEAIHPFFDGNGRTGRILNILIMLNKNLLHLPILYLSRYIVHNKSKYYKNLRAVTEDQAWEPWILYVLDVIETTAGYTIRKIEEIESLLSSTVQAVGERYPNLPKEVVEAVFSQPYIRSENLVENEIYKVKSRPTANAHLKKLVALGVVNEPEKMGREMVYINQKLIDIISDGER